MKFEERLKEKIGTETGYKVPDGFFETTYNRILGSLPEREPKKHISVSRWQKWRPYIYLAAMFAGIWCMMKIVSNTLPVPDMSLDNASVQVAQLMDDYDSDEADIYIETSTPLEDIDLMEDISEEYTSISDFEKDFGYELEKDYANLDVSAYSRKAYVTTPEKELAQN